MICLRLTQFSGVHTKILISNIANTLKLVSTVDPWYAYECTNYDYENY